MPTVEHAVRNSNNNHNHNNGHSITLSSGNTSSKHALEADVAGDGRSTGTSAQKGQQQQQQRPRKRTLTSSSTTTRPLSKSKSASSSSLDDLSHGDLLAKQSDVTVGGDAVPPETEYFGFALYVGSFVAVAVCLAWAYLPRWVLQRWLNIYYYPSRWWALAVPAELAMGMVYIYVALAAYNVEVLTRGVGDLNNVTDRVARVVPGRGAPVRVASAKEQAQAPPTPTPTPMQVPVSAAEEARRHSTIEEGDDDQALSDGQQPFPTIQRRSGGGGSGGRYKSSAPATPTTLSASGSPFSSPVSSSTHLPSLSSFTTASQQKYSLDYYLFNPSDGVLDLPLSEVCNVLYGNE